jgi:RimJ/RimL family protein N-acetyltransferase
MITLRPFVDTDARLLLDWVTTEEQMVLWSGTMFSWPLTEPRLAAIAASPFRRSWIGENRASGAAVGHIAFSVDETHRSGRISCVLIAPAARGGGHGAALVNAILDMAFGELRLHRVGLGVYARNATALRLYERLGFVREGVIRDSARVNGEWWSTVEMGMLETERPTGRR